MSIQAQRRRLPPRSPPTQPPLPAPPENSLWLKFVAWKGNVIHRAGIDPDANFAPLWADQMPYVMREKVADWCFEHIGPYRLRDGLMDGHHHVVWIEFKNPADMLVFKMQWGSLS